jgi:hypothetical protein
MGRHRTQRRRHVQFNEAPDQPVGPLELRGDQHMDVLRAGLGQQVLHKAAGKTQRARWLTVDAVENDKAVLGHSR